MDGNKSEPKYSRKSIVSAISIGKNGQPIVKRKLSEIIAINWDKYVYTFCILYIYMTYGLTSSIFPPAMVDFKFLFRTSMATINLMSTVGAVGYLLGALCGFLYKYINRQMTLLLSVAMMSVFIGLLPDCQTIWQLFFANFIAQMGGGAWDAGNSCWTIEMWGPRASVFLQLSQMTYGLGTILGPVLVRPYVLGDLNRTHADSHTIAPTLTTTLAFIGTTFDSISNSSDDDINYSVDRRPKLRVPFVTGGSMTLIGPAILLVMFLIKRYKIPAEESQRDNQKNNNILIKEEFKGPIEQSPRTRKCLIALVALLLNSESSMEVVYFGTLSAYLQYLKGLEVSASEAAIVLMIMSITYTLGRFVSAFISTKLKAEVMITYHLVTMAVSYSILFIGQSLPSKILIYIGNGLIGFGFSAMWPSIFTFSEMYIKLNDKITAIFSFTSMFFSVISPFIIGPLLESHPEVFLIIEISYFSSVVVLFMIIMFIVNRSQRYPIMYSISNEEVQENCYIDPQTIIDVNNQDNTNHNQQSVITCH